MWEWSTDADIWIAASTFLLFVVTAALAFFTYRLWRSTGRLVVGADDTAKRQLRAYIGVDFVPQRAGALWIGAPKFGALYFKITNTGQSPAKEVVIDAAYDVRPWPTSDHESLLSILPESEDSKTVIHPNQERIGRANRLQDFGQMDTDKLAMGTDIRLHLFGRIAYKDILDESHSTTFCVTIYGNAVREIFGWNPQTTTPIDLWYVHCPFSNDAD